MLQHQYCLIWYVSASATDPWRQVTWIAEWIATLQLWVIIDSFSAFGTHKCHDRTGKNTHWALKVGFSQIRDDRMFMDFYFAGVFCPLVCNQDRFSAQNFTTVISHFPKIFMHWHVARTQSCHPQNWLTLLGRKHENTRIGTSVFKIFKMCQFSRSFELSHFGSHKVHKAQH